jgi:hypothetical protein
MREASGRQEGYKRGAIGMDCEGIWFRDPGGHSITKTESKEGRMRAYRERDLVE